MTPPAITELDRKLAKLCLTCPVCQHARRRQAGFAFWVVQKVETRICPACRAYERVYGRKSHEALASHPPPDPPSTK